MKNIIKGVFNVIFWVVVSVALTISLNCHIQKAQGIQQPMLFGYGFAVVETGSMEPNVPTGSLIVVKSTGSYEVGDVITYTNAQNVSITHRVVAIDGRNVTAQGDANSIADPVFDVRAISGEVIYTNQKAGVVVKIIQSPVTMWVLIGLVILSFVWDGVSSVIKKKKSNNTKEEIKTIEGNVDSIQQ